MDSAIMELPAQLLDGQVTARTALFREPSSAQPATTARRDALQLAVQNHLQYARALQLLWMMQATPAVIQLILELTTALPLEAALRQLKSALTSVLMTMTEAPVL
ncbi:MAG: hypothetical protein D6698_15960 [Gammaproteobacteria bacterium]|nr:MAG: hypothetical protein D6698_15960 [Gammaproteobacteria bacterium]